MLLSITVSSCLLLLYRFSESTLPALLALISYLLIKGVKSPAPFPVFLLSLLNQIQTLSPLPFLSLSLSLCLINSISNTSKAYLWDSWTELINSEAEWLTQVHNTWMALIHCGHFHSRACKVHPATHLLATLLCQHVYKLHCSYELSR